MFGKIAAKFARFLLNNVHLSTVDRNLLTTCILDNLAALPLRDMIRFSEDGTLFVNGKIVDPEMARILRESAKGALDNVAMKYIYDQVIYQAMSIGTYKAETEAQVFFGKCAVWGEQQKYKHLQTLASYGIEKELDL